MQREQLIAYSLKYRGEYFAVLKALKRREAFEVPAVFPECLTILDRNYPERFLSLTYPPLVLYYHGDLQLLQSRTVAVVGSRHPDPYALKATTLLVQRLRDTHTIVSGLAMGVDITAHKNAKRTIGILGSGIDLPYPTINSDFIMEAYKTQLVLSEYPDQVKPLKHHFPFRNRLIAALADELCVMEAREKSGTLTTLNHAMELGKTVYVLPFACFKDERIINNRLIQEGANVIEFN